MNKDIYYPVPFERQSTLTSCAAKAAQLVMNYHDPDIVELGSAKEMEILNHGRLQGYDVATHPAIAVYALDRGFEVTHISCGPELFRYPENRPGPFMPRREFDEKVALDHVFNKAALRKGLKQAFHAAITQEILLGLLEKGPVTCMTQEGPSNGLHDVVVAGFRNGNFQVVDPILGDVERNPNTLLNAINTAYGPSMLLIR